MSLESIKELSAMLLLVCNRSEMYLPEVSLSNIVSYIIGYENGCGAGYDAGSDSFNYKFSQFLLSKYNKQYNNFHWISVIREVAKENDINDIELLKLNLKDFIEKNVDVL